MRCECIAGTRDSCWPAGRCRAGATGNLRRGAFVSPARSSSQYASSRIHTCTRFNIFRISMISISTSYVLRFRSISCSIQLLLRRLPVGRPGHPCRAHVSFRRERIPCRMEAFVDSDQQHDSRRPCDRTLHSHPQVDFQLRPRCYENFRAGGARHAVRCRLCHDRGKSGGCRDGAARCCWNRPHPQEGSRRRGEAHPNCKALSVVMRKARL